MPVLLYEVSGTDASDRFTTSSVYGYGLYCNSNITEIASKEIGQVSFYFRYSNSPGSGQMRLGVFDTSNNQVAVSSDVATSTLTSGYSWINFTLQSPVTLPADVTGYKFVVYSGSSSIGNLVVESALKNAPPTNNQRAYATDSNSPPTSFSNNSGYQVSIRIYENEADTVNIFPPPPVAYI